MTGARPTVGFVGVGAMGEPMIASLASAGFEVRAHDANPERVSAVAGLSRVTWVESLTDFGGLDLVVCMLPGSPAVRKVLSGSKGLFNTLPKGALVIDMGSSDPMDTQALAGEAAASGVELVDAPVSGGVAKARTGELTIMFGGTEEQLDRCLPVLKAIGDKVIPVGGVGSGHAMKALNNLLSAVGLAAAAEVVEVGRRYGLDADTMLDVINHSTGRNHATENKMSQFVLSGSFASGFGLRLMVKDITTALGLAHSMRVPCPIGEACLELWSDAAERLPADADHTRIALMPAELTGTARLGGS